MKNIKLVRVIISSIVFLLSLIIFIMAFLPAMKISVGNATLSNPNLPTLAFDTNHNFTANQNGSRIVPSMLFFVAIAIFIAAIYECICYTLDYFGLSIKGFRINKNETKTAIISTIVVFIALGIMFAVFSFLIPNMVGMNSYYSVAGSAIVSGIMYILLVISYSIGQATFILKK